MIDSDTYEPINNGSFYEIFIPSKQVVDSFCLDPHAGDIDMSYDDRVCVVVFRICPKIVH